MEKRMLAICITLFVCITCFAVMPANAYDPIISPTAPTYTVPDYTDVTKEEDPGTTRWYTIPFDPTEISSLISEISSRFGGGARTSYTVTYTNPGKDDPSSPNYTGTITGATRDNSSRSPDTATGSNAAPIAIALLTMASAAVFAGKALKKKEETED